MDFAEPVLRYSKIIDKFIRDSYQRQLIALFGQRLRSIRDLKSNFINLRVIKIEIEVSEQASK